jgi:hypothetical protein
LILTLLGDEAFEKAISFLRSVASIPLEDDNDDEYLLLEMEEILGVDGLIHMDEMYTLITLEDELAFE